MVDISGLGRLIDQYTGEPAELRWLSIHPDGRVIGRRSDNLIAWWVRYEMWVQFCLLRDVYRVVDPLSRGFGVQPAGLMIDTPGHGVVIVKRRGAEDPPNRVATAMLAAVGVEHEVSGTVAWIGARDRVTGFHADLSGVDELRTLAAHCRITRGGGHGRS